MVTVLAAPAFPMDKPTLFRGSRASKSLEVTGNMPNFIPASASRLQIKRDTRAYLKKLDDVIVAGPRDHERLLHRQVYRQNFTIRSFEIGSDFKISIEALMNYLQETGLNQLKSAGIVADGTFGSTLEMSARDIIWVVCRMDVQVDYYPSWADVVQVETWIYKSGKNSFCREWHVRNFSTGRILIRAASLNVLMNKKNRKFAKLSEEVINQLKPYLIKSNPDNRKRNRNLLQLDAEKAEYVRTGLTPGWTDMDTNQHVSHIKLVNYVLESVPRSVLESHEISSITLEYRKECNRDSVLRSFSRVSGSSSSNQLIDNGGIELEHFLCLESTEQEIVRGRTMWRPKLYENNSRDESSSLSGT